MWLLYFTLVISVIADNVTLSPSETTQTTYTTEDELTTENSTLPTTTTTQEVVPIDDTDDETSRKWNAADFPNPLLSPERCKRHSASYICDPDHILSIQQADLLNDMITEYRNNSQCICHESCTQDGGMAIGVAILEHMFLPYNEPMDDIGKAFAEDLYNQWSLGSCGDSIIIMVATKDEQSSTYVSENLRPYIPPALSEQIWNASKGHFQNNYYQGLESMIESFYDVMKSIQPRAAPAPSTHRLIASNTFIGLIIGFLIMFGLAVIFSIFYYQRHALKTKDRPPKAPKPKPTLPGERKRSITVKGINFPTTKYQVCSMEDEEKRVGQTIVPIVIPRHLSDVPEETDEDETHPSNTSPPSISTFQPVVTDTSDTHNATSSPSTSTFQPVVIDTSDTHNATSSPSTSTFQPVVTEHQQPTTDVEP